MPLDNATPSGINHCPVEYSEEEIEKSTQAHDQEDEKMQELSEMKDIIGIDALGWLPDTEHLERARDVTRAIKEGLMAHSETELEQIAVQSHFPFEDHDE